MTATPSPPSVILPWWAPALDRALALAGDGVFVGLLLLAVALGALPHELTQTVLGYALRSIVRPSTDLGTIFGGSLPTHGRPRGGAGNGAQPDGVGGLLG